MIKLNYAKSDKIVTDERIICNIFNDYFSNVAKEIGFDDEIPDDFQMAGGFEKIIDKHSSHPSIIQIKEHSSAERSFVFRDINGSEVEKMIETIDPKKAQGFDYVPSKVLRRGASDIAHHISSTIKYSLQLCIFPDMFKLAELSSFYKKNDNLHKGNYRPVSVLPSVSKIYECVMAVQLCDFFDHIFSALLSAFRKRYSCQSTLLNMIEHFKKSLDRGEYVACLSMDLIKHLTVFPIVQLSANCMHMEFLGKHASWLQAIFIAQAADKTRKFEKRMGWTQ